MRQCAVAIGDMVADVTPVECLNSQTACRQKLREQVFHISPANVFVNQRYLNLCVILPHANFEEILT